MSKYFVYDYKCIECEHVFEVWMKPVQDEHPMESCEKCGGVAHHILSPVRIDYLNMGVDAVGNPTSGDKWARMHEIEGKKHPA